MTLDHFKSDLLICALFDAYEQQEKTQSIDEEKDLELDEFEK